LQTNAKKLFAISAIALLAFNLRTAVSSLSPIVGFISVDIPLPIITIGLLGIAAPLSFALATSISSRPAKRLGVEKTLGVTVAMIVLGHLLRALAWDSSSLFVGSLLSLLGAGIGNVLLPVMVRKYFPNRVGIVSSFYITLTAVSATLGSLIAVPMAERFDWRIALGQWAVMAVLTMIPLAALLPNSKPATLEEDKVKPIKKIWRSPTALAIAGTQSMTSVFGYVAFAWMPLILIEHNGVTPAEGGALLSLFALMGLPASLVVPILADKFRKSQTGIVWFSVVMAFTGSLGLIFAPKELLWLVMIVMGLGPTMFPLALTLFNLRSRQRSTVLAVSAFGQGVSYSTAAVVVFTFGILRELTGNWNLALWVFVTVAALASVIAFQIRKHQYIDDELKTRPSD
jgi:CP family cyanate transporter-like MFS transporter